MQKTEISKMQKLKCKLNKFIHNKPTCCKQFYIINICKLVLNIRSYLFNLFLSLKNPKTMAHDHFAKKITESIHYIKENIRRKSGHWNF